MKPKLFKKCILHIGSEKTGTTAIQHYLRSNRPELARRGFLYPVAMNAEHSSQWEFVVIAHHAPWLQDMGKQQGILDAASQHAFRVKLTQILEKEFAKNKNAQTLIISSEHFQSRLYTDKEISFIKSFLSEWVEEFQVVVYFRRQDELALSLLSTRLKSSSKLELEDVMAALNSPVRYYEYDKIYGRWAKAFGSDAISSLIYDPKFWPDGDLVSDFCRATSLPKLRYTPQRLNPSLDRKGFQFIHAINELYPITPGDQSDKKRVALIKLVSELFAGKFYPISKAQALSFYNQFDPANRRLRKLAFPAMSEPIFSDDFSHYPDTPEPLRPEYLEAVEVALTLWNAVYEQDNKDGKLSLLNSLFKKKR
ncbi:MAG: hypothetical protein ACX94B_00350 [Henriciella sp.]